jgi:hypothetical protein
MFGKTDLPTKIRSDGAADILWELQFQPCPKSDCSSERCVTVRRILQVRFEQPFILDHRLLVEDDDVNVGGAQLSFPETVLDGRRRKCRIVFAASEPFFLSGSNDLAVPDKSRSRIVIERRNSQYVCHENSLARYGCCVTRTLSNMRSTLALVVERSWNIRQRFRKVALTVLSPFIVTVQAPVPEQSPPHPTKMKFRPGVAVSVTVVPGG